MFSKVGAVAAAAVGILGLIPATEAAASHHFGGAYSQCLYPTGSYNGVSVAVDGVASEVPSNYYIAAKGRVGPDCVKAAGKKIARVQIDKLYLASITGTIYGSILNQNNGTNSITSQSSGAHVPCGVQIRVQMRFSVRYSDGALTSGYMNGPGFYRCQ
jgi:hypothetical protein